MTPDRLLDHFDRISDAPDAIPRLRRFILDLAVRGKLVEQDLNDEPASELIKGIFAKLQTTGSESAVTEGYEHLFDLPASWSWIKVGHAAHIEMGQSPPSDHYNQSRQGIPFYQGKTDFGRRHPTPRYWCSQPSKLAFKDDILICVRAPVGPTNVANEECCIGRGLAALRPHEGVDLEFFLLCLKSFESALASLGFGTTFVAINKKQLKSFLIPLPPLAEQHRIVAKVDELMALCDRLEAAQAERESRRDRLTAASLHRLNNGANADEVRANVGFHLRHLPRLTTRPDHIQQLRQTILNLAVRGQLVPQDPKDEPASNLIARIQTDRAQMTKEGRTGRAPQLPTIDEANAPFALPPGWAWARFPELGKFGRGKSKHRPRNDPSLFEGGTHLLVQTGDVARSNGVIETFTGKYNEVGLAQSANWPKGTLCITIAANIADSGILSFDACFPDSVVGFVPAAIFPNARYFEYFIRTAKAELLEFAPATAQKNINLTILNEVLVPLPPLTEQHRIVAKVDELMALCDRLEAQLTTVQTESGRLLEAALAEVLAT